MGKEVDLLKAVRQNDLPKIQKLLSPGKGYLVRQRSIPPTPSRHGGRDRMREQLTHINVNCREHTNDGYTPLIITVLNGNKEIAEVLLMYSADVDLPDSKRNTAIHLAIFAGHVDMVDLLLQNNARLDVQNSDGNTPLHIVCQCDYDHRITMILHVLKFSPSLYIRNKVLAIALDIAAMFNKKDIVSIMLDHDPSLKQNTTAIIEASIRGHVNIVELLLDYGVSPNCISQLKETGPLHEATRFGRMAVIRMLLDFGANPEVPNIKNESSIQIANGLPKSSSAEVLKMFEEISPISPMATPRFLEKNNAKLFAAPTKCYPELPSDSTWTRNVPEYCNSCTPNNPNTNILDGNLRTFWGMQEVHHAWTVLDLRHKHTLTGITVHGWDSPQMVQCFEMQRGDDLEGPWTAVGSFICKSFGSSNAKDDAIPQSFSNFEASSRYWRFHVLSNFGGSYTCFQGITLSGADDRVAGCLDKLGLTQYTDQFICKGCNTYRKLLLQDDTEIQEVCQNIDQVKTLSEELKRLRKSEFKLSQLKWKQPPPCTSAEDTVLPDLSVTGDRGCTDVVGLSVEGGCDVLRGSLTASLHSAYPHTPPVACFTGIRINQSGTYRIQVQSKSDTNIVVCAPADIIVKPSSNLSQENKDAFNDIDSMLTELVSAFPS